MTYRLRRWAEIERWRAAFSSTASTWSSPWSWAIAGLHAANALFIFWVALQLVDRVRAPSKAYRIHSQATLW